MADPKQPAAHDEDHAHPEGPWREEEKGLGAGVPSENAGTAGEATTKGRPHDDRARTEGAAADITRHGGDEEPRNPPPPAPDTPMVGGIGATETRPAEDGAERKPG
jgi:hypothetical protein